MTYNVRQIKHAAVLSVAAVCISLASASEAHSQDRLVAPSIVSVTPVAPIRNAAAQLLTVTGTGFSPGISLTVASPDGRKAKYDRGSIQARGETSFQVAVVLAAAGAYALTVMNADGATSEPFALQSRLPTGTPRIDRVRPDQLTKDPQPRVLTISGDGFAPGLSVSLTDPIGVVYLFTGTAIGSLTQTSFNISVTIELTGDYSLMVTNPSSESSNNMTITVAMRR